ncbi:MAG: Tim44 domain-containing protein, partial [Deltaproteobacteria bacterium]|nr:Tim44 domain-containing protein [Deltaproteobacteria bacterium]
MKKLFIALFVSVVALGLRLGEAEAARLGGGKSVGMQRQSVAPTPARQATPAPAAPAPAAAPAAAPKRNWMGPLAGLAAGLGIAALLSHFGMGEGMANILMIGLLVMAAFFIFKMLFRRSPAPVQEPMQYAGSGSAGIAPPPQTESYPASSGPVLAPAPQALPEGFDAEAFLRVAKLNFVRLQAANDSRNLDDIREFVSPEMYAEIKMQIDERGAAQQQTDVVTLNAELLEVTTE